MAYLLDLIVVQIHTWIGKRDRETSRVLLSLCVCGKKDSGQWPAGERQLSGGTSFIRARTAGPSTPAEAVGRDDTDKGLGSVGMTHQESVNSSGRDDKWGGCQVPVVSCRLSSCQLADAQMADRFLVGGTAGPSTRSELLGRDDTDKRAGLGQDDTLKLCGKGAGVDVRMGAGCELSSGAGGLDTRAYRVSLEYNFQAYAQEKSQ